MDDLVHGAFSIKQGTKIVNDLNSLLQSGGFILRKWSSNSQKILENITEQASNNITFNFKTENTSKTLGLCWKPDQDILKFNIETPPQTSKVTKRTLLSEISKIYDPLGWLAPVTSKIKILFQKVWKSKTQWDQQVSDDIYKEWSKLRAEIHIVNNIEIPRWILCNEHDVIELHGFCDASMEAYGCVVYARIKQQPKVLLVAAKSKLVPLNKTITLPRLELSGALLLTKLMNKIKQALRQHTIETYGWTDSMVALGWLNGEPGRWKPFVANRVEKITNILPKQHWHYVKTDENPADSVSRGQYPSQLQNNSLWWNSPSWLSTFDTLSETIQKTTFTTNLEKKLGQTNIVQSKDKENIIDQLLEKYSSFTKVIRILAWIQRAFNPIQSRRLTLQELRKATTTIVKHVQNSEFGTDMKYLRKHGHLHSNSKLLKLNAYIDREDVLRVGGRLSEAAINMEMKHPKIIPKDCRLAELLIDRAHQLTYHGGPRLTLANLRQEY